MKTREIGRAGTIKMMQESTPLKTSLLFILEAIYG